MNLRPLRKEDAPLMLEWMQDPTVVQYMFRNFDKLTIVDCEEFIVAVQEDKMNCHMAIVDEHDAYMGTVSLKHIYNGTAEFAITIRKNAMGKGFSCFAIKEILRIAFDEMNLDKVYWYVASENQRAIRFYNKNGYKQIDYETIISEISLPNKQEILAKRTEIVWYQVEK